MKVYRIWNATENRVVTTSNNPEGFYGQESSAKKALSHIKKRWWYSKYKIVE